MTEKAEIRREIETLGKELGILIEASSGSLPYILTVPDAIKAILSGVYASNNHKVSILKMVTKEYE